MTLRAGRRARVPVPAAGRRIGRTDSVPLTRSRTTIASDGLFAWSSTRPSASCTSAASGSMRSASRNSCSASATRPSGCSVENVKLV